MNEKSCVSLLRTAAQKKDLCKGRKVHAFVAQELPLRNGSSLLKALVEMYAKCSAVTEAQDLLHELSVRDAAVWNALIVAYAHNGQAEHALRCFEQMQLEGFLSNEVAFFCILKVCGSTKAEHYKGEQVFVKQLMRGLQANDFVLGTALVTMYTKCGELAKAQQVLRKLPRRDAACWNALIAGYAQEGQGSEALSLFEQMKQEGLSPSPITYTCVLKACATIGALDKGSEIHDEIVEQGLLVNDVALGSALVSMYINCGALTKAKKILEEIPIFHVVLWNALIAQYIERGQEHDAFDCFKHIQQSGPNPDTVTFICILKACGNIKAEDVGYEIHDYVVRQGLLSGNINLGNALVAMYAKCGALDKAEQVLEELPVRDVISWSALIAGYSQQGHGQEALDCFIRMQDDGLSPNTVTFLSLLKACASIKDVGLGEQVHDEILRQGLLESSIDLGNALVDMYCKCGALTKAEEVLEKLPKQDVISWNALIAGYAQHEDGEKALSCYQLMQRKAISEDEVTLACLLKAYGSLGSLSKGEQIHEKIASEGLLTKNVVLGNALIDMYAKCGAPAQAKLMLNGLHSRNAISWSTLVAGYAIQGQAQEALQCLINMQDEGLLPNKLTFASLLKACNHSGLVDEGHMCFLDMQELYDITPVSEHHACMVDLLGRAGLFVEAMALIELMPSIEFSLVCSTLWNICKKKGGLNVGKWDFQHLVQTHEGDFTLHGSFVYSLQEDAEQVAA